VLAVRRAKVLGGDAVAWLHDFVPEGVLPFETLRQEFAGSILDILLAHREVGLEYADTEIRPVNLPNDIATLLDVPPGMAALFTDSVPRTAEGRVVEWAQGWLLPEHLRFRVRRRRQVGH
jgi:DNA-binding GntR family transcriptional regulator